MDVISSCDFRPLICLLLKELLEGYLGAGDKEISPRHTAGTQTTSSIRSESEAQTGLIRCLQTGDSVSRFAGSSAGLHGFTLLRRNFLQQQSDMFPLSRMVSGANAPNQEKHIDKKSKIPLSHQ